MGWDAEVLIIGGGHAGLSIAHGLRGAGRGSLIVDRHVRIGDAWRHRWDSLELFTPRSLDGLPGLPFPKGPTPFPGKDDVADYQEEYCLKNRFPVHLGSTVRSLRRVADGLVAELDTGPVRAKGVVVATGQFHAPKIPPFANGLDDRVLQLHSEEYRRPTDLPDGPVLVVGAANSGAEIAVEVARYRPTTVAISKRFPQAPKRYRDPRMWRIAYIRGAISRDAKLPSFLPWPLRLVVYTKVEMDRAARDHGLRLAPRVVSADGDRIRFADGTASTVRTVIWATGFRTDHSWIEGSAANGVTTLGPHGRGPLPGSWFVGARFLFGINRYAREVVRDLDRQLERGAR